MRDNAIRYSYKQDHGARALASLLASGSEFATLSRSMSGFPGSCEQPGELSPEWFARLSADAKRMRYVVLSYHTPIAWQLDDGSWVQVDEKFSSTTSAHQAKLADAISRLAG